MDEAAIALRRDGSKPIAGDALEAGNAVYSRIFDGIIDRRLTPGAQ